MGKQPGCRLILAGKEEAHSSQVLAGFKLLERSGQLHIDAFALEDLRQKGYYAHRSIVEVAIAGQRLAYDTGDGYQSLHRPDVWDEQLERVDAY
ncbi:MAG: hypothetical protein LBS96_00320, partial [Oscillospiraceae bacterium]|nr:hypothetical protein [Oscillospiraceae bacterium]